MGPNEEVGSHRSGRISWRHSAESRSMVCGIFRDDESEDVSGSEEPRASLVINFAMPTRNRFCGSILNNYEWQNECPGIVSGCDHRAALLNPVTIYGQSQSTQPSRLISVPVCVSLRIP